MEIQAEKKKLIKASQLARLESIKTELINSLQGTDEASARYVENMPCEHLASICFIECLANESVLEGLKRTISMFVLFDSIFHKQQ